MNPQDAPRAGEHASQTSSRRYREVYGNIPDARALVEGSVQQRIPGAFPVDADAHYHFAQPDYTPRFFTTLARSAFGALSFWVSTTPLITEQDGVHTATDLDDPPPPYTSGEYVILEEESDNEGVRIAEAFGNVATSALGRGATSEQDFHGLCPELGRLAREIPSAMPAAVRSGETSIGRVYGNLRTGHVGVDAVSRQSFGPGQTNHNGGTREGYTVFVPQHVQSSTSSFPPSTQGQTLGQAPSGARPTTGARRRL